jgi:hypothetical protein
MSGNTFLVLGGPQQEQLQQILAKMKQNEERESQNTVNTVIHDKSPLFDEIENRNNTGSWPQVSALRPK